MSDDKTRYSDEELQEFKQLIEEKLNKARKEYDFLIEAVKNPEESGNADDMSNQLFDDNRASSEKEYLSQMAERQKKFIQNLEKALVRIENKTYGICQQTGKLISKERLKAVPHTTLSIEAKTGNS